MGLQRGWNDAQPPRPGRRAGALGLAMLLAIPLAAAPVGLAAQTAAELTPPTFAPETRPLTGSLVFTGEPGLGAPPGAEALTIVLSGVEIEGGLPQMADAYRAVEARLTAGRIPASEIFVAAQELEAAHARAGFVLARVVLPEQELRDGGWLRLSVIDGFVEVVDIDAVPGPVRGRVRDVVAPLAGRPGLTLDEIERRLLIAGDTFGTALESALARGETPGGTQLLLDGQFRPVTGFVGVDRGLSGDLGNWSLDAGLEVNSAFGLAETLYLRLSTHPGSGIFGSTPRMRTLAAGAVLPIGTDGLTLTLEGADSRTTPERADAVPTTSRFDRLSLRLAYPLQRSRARTLSARLVLDVQSDRQDVLAPDGRVPVYRDRLRVLRLGGTLVNTLSGGGFVELDAVASLGLDALGARSAADAIPEVPLSRQGADASFTALTVSAELTRPLGEHLVGALTARGQTAFGAALPKSEQIGLAGAGLVSGLEPGSVAGDSAWMLRGELRLPREAALAERPVRLQPYAFGAMGALYLHEPTAVEQRRTRVSSIGLGMELVSLADSPFTSASARVEIARGFRNDGRPDDDRISVGAALRF